MEEFGSRLSAEEIEALRKAKRELEASRGAMVERIYPLVKDASPRMRRFLLRLKRDCFNGRPLGQRIQTREWQEFSRMIGSSANDLIKLEEKLAERQQSFEAAFDLERDLEHGRLLEALDDRFLMRGIAVGSPVVAEQLKRFRTTSTSGRLGRRKKRLQLTLLRYLSRASLKLSPFSTLTPVALGRLIETSKLDADVPLAEFIDGEWKERSLLRTQRYFLDQICEILLTHPPFQAGLEILVNETIEELEPNYYRWFRPGRWEIDRDKRTMRYRRDSVVKARLGGPMIASLRKILASQPDLIYEKLLARLIHDFGDSSRAGILETLEQLRRIGFIYLRTPWPSNEGYLESSLVTHLRKFTDQPELKHLCDAFENLIALEKEFSKAEDPSSALAVLGRQADEVWQRTQDLGDAEQTIEPVKLKEKPFVEDVIFESEIGGSEPEVIRIQAARMGEVARSVKPLVSLSSFFNFRIEFLLTLGAFISRHWPQSREVSALELFEKAKHLYRDWMNFGRQASPEAYWNPLETEEIERLFDLRQTIAKRMKHAISSDGDASRLCSESLNEILAEVPEIFQSPVGGCLFLQPADLLGKCWVMNRLFEGTGRYGSRFTPLLNAEARQQYASNFIAGASLDWNGKSFELFDLMYPHGDTLNVHVPLTRKILMRPGERSDAAEESHVSLGDLRVRIDPESDWPGLAHTSGEPYLPVHLGGTARQYIPKIFQFLSLIGVGEVSLSFLFSRGIVDHGARFLRRLMLDDIVVYRQRWFFERKTIPQELFSRSDKEAFLAFDSWRKRQGLPDRLFFIENIPHPSRHDLYKPQYLDLTSPLFVSLLQSSLKDHHGLVTFEELMPTSEAALVNRQGQRFMVEFLLDTLAI